MLKVSGAKMIGQNIKKFIRPLTLVVFLTCSLSFFALTTPAFADDAVTSALTTFHANILVLNESFAANKDSLTQEKIEKYQTDISSLLEQLETVKRAVADLQEEFLRERLLQQLDSEKKALQNLSLDLGKTLELSQDRIIQLLYIDLVAAANKLETDAEALPDQYVSLDQIKSVLADVRVIDLSCQAIINKYPLDYYGGTIGQLKEFKGSVQSLKTEIKTDLSSQLRSSLPTQLSSLKDSIISLQNLVYSLPVTEINEQLKTVARKFDTDLSKVSAGVNGIGSKPSQPDDIDNFLDLDETSADNLVAGLSSLKTNIAVVNELIASASSDNLRTVQIQVQTVSQRANNFGRVPSGGSFKAALDKFSFDNESNIDSFEDEGQKNVQYYAANPNLLKNNAYALATVSEGVFSSLGFYKGYTQATKYDKADAAFNQETIGAPYLDPVLSLNLDALPHKPYGDKTTKIDNHYLTDQEKEEHAKGVYYVVGSGTATDWGDVWCDVFYVKKGATLKIKPYTYDKYKKEYVGGYLTIHAKVIKIDGKIDGKGVGYLGIKGTVGGTGGKLNNSVGFLGSYNENPPQSGGWPTIDVLANGKYYGKTLAKANNAQIWNPAFSNPPNSPWCQGGEGGGSGGYGKPGGGFFEYYMDGNNNVNWEYKDNGVLMGAGGGAGQGGGGGGGGGKGNGTDGGLYYYKGGHGGDAGNGGSGGSGGNGGGLVKLYAKYSLEISANANIDCRGNEGTSGYSGSNGASGDDGAGSWDDDPGSGGIANKDAYGNGIGWGENGHDGQPAASGGGGGGGGAGGKGGDGSYGAGGGILLQCDFPIEKADAVHTSINNKTLGLAISSSATIDNRAGSTKGAYPGALKVIYAKDRPAGVSLLHPGGTAKTTTLFTSAWQNMISFQLPYVTYSQPQKGEIYSAKKPMTLKWQAQSGKNNLNGKLIIYCYNPNGQDWVSYPWKTVVIPWGMGKSGKGEFSYQTTWDTTKVYESPGAGIGDTKNARLRYVVEDDKGFSNWVETEPFTIDNTAPNQPAMSVTHPTGTTYETQYLLWTKDTKPVVKWQAIEKTAGLDLVEFALDYTDSLPGSLYSVTDWKDLAVEGGKIVIKGSMGLLAKDWVDVYSLSSPYFKADSAGNNNGQINLDTTSWPDGQYTFNVRVRDAAYNYSKAGTFVYNKDTTAPAMNLYYYDAYGTKNTYPYPQTVKWINIDNYPLTLTATDNASGLAKINYSIGSKSYSKSFTVGTDAYKDKVDLPGSSSTDFNYGNGTFVIKYSAEDRLGQKATEVSQTVYLDNTKPTVTIDKSLAGLKVTKGYTDYYYSVTKLTGTAKDQATLSGVDPTKVMVSIVKGTTSSNLEYFKDGWQTPYIEKNSWQAAAYDSATGTWQLDLSKTPLSVKTADTVTVYVKATDLAGNESVKAYLGVEMTPIDTSAPKTVLQYFNSSINDFANIPSSTPKQWIKSDTVRVYANDSDVGVKSITYDLDDAGNVVVSDFSGKVSGANKSGSDYYLTLPVAKLTEGTHKITYTAEDNLGNKALNKTETFYVDTKVPTIKLSQINGAAVPNQYEPSYKDLTSVGCNGSDTGSGVKEVKVKLSNVKTVTQVDYWDGKAWTSTPTYLSAVYDSTKKLWVLDLTSGTYSPIKPLAGSTAKEYITIYYKGTDNSGQVSTENYKTVVVDPLLSTTKPQSAPQNVKASISSGKVSISWDSVTGASKYNIYRVTTYPDQLKVAATPLGSSTGNNYVDNTTTNPVGDNKNYYYVVRAGNAAGESANSKIIGVLNYSLVSGKNWVSIPLEGTGIKLASGLWTDLGLSSGDLIERPDSGLASYSNYYGGSDPLLGTIGNEFAVAVGGCYRVTVASSKSWTLIGLVPATHKFTLANGKNWLYVPLSKTGITNASGLWTAIGLSNGDLIEQPDVGKSSYSNYYGGSDPLLGTIGTDFSVPFNPTKCYRVTIKTGKQWP